MQLFCGGEEFAKKKDIVNPNLLKGTANFDQKFWGELQLSGKDYLGNDQFEATTAWFGPHETINVRPGDVITISGIVKLNIDACQIGIPAGDTKYNDTAVVVTRSPQIFVDGQSRGTGYINITDQNYHVLSATYEVTQGGTLNPRFESSSDQTNFLLSSMKAEYGSVATAWCPAYADYVAKSDFDNKVNVDAPMYHRITNNDTWADMLGVDNAGHNVLISLRDDTNGGIPNSPTAGGNGAGIAFGGFDTKGILTADWLHPTAKISAGNADKPQWSEEIAWKSDIQKLQDEIDQLKQNK